VAIELKSCGNEEGGAESEERAPHRECRKRKPWKMYLTVPDLSDMAPRFTSTMSPTATWEHHINNDAIGESSLHL